ncbi:MAG: saccharopine dehydrogenase NADP-binding domain-containing protein, partial [Porticoccaceae bacterium]|nr:saccharopine dehydrogenase NADP-binding domain-containing protein [Porticoccaceae bacterium]
MLIIGGYGNFGRFIARRLGADENIQLVIAGRSAEKAQALIAEMDTANPAQAAQLDIGKNLRQSLQAIKPDIVIHTSGPFQGQGYDVADACIECGAHYIDLADGREFVAGINALDAEAKVAGVFVVSGASSVP